MEELYSVMCLQKDGERMALARGIDNTPPFLPDGKEKRTGVAPGSGIYRFRG